MTDREQLLQMLTRAGLDYLVRFGEPFPRRTPHTNTVTLRFHDASVAFLFDDFDTLMNVAVVADGSPRDAAGGTSP